VRLRQRSYSFGRSGRGKTRTCIRNCADLVRPGGGTLYVSNFLEAVANKLVLSNYFLRRPTHNKCIMFFKDRKDNLAGVYYTQLYYRINHNYCEKLGSQFFSMEN
jgi:hypothetical protein